MSKNLENTWKKLKRRGKYVILGYSFLGGIYSCFIDWDHIFLYLGIPEPINYTGIEGRPFHTIDFLLFISVICAIVLTAFMVRYLES